jgi:hypothetical protein
METQELNGLSLMKAKFEAYRKLADEKGEGYAREKMLEGYPERQREKMGAFINNTTLSRGFSKAIPFYKQMGMDMEVIDISNNGTDAVLEIQKTCPVLPFSKDYGFDEPCHVVCEMDVEATRRAFPRMNGEILCRQARGSAVCIFKYERGRVSE